MWDRNQNLDHFIIVIVISLFCKKKKVWNINAFQFHSIPFYVNVNGIALTISWFWWSFHRRSELIANCTPTSTNTHTHIYSLLVSAMNGNGDQSLNEPYCLCLDCTRCALKEKHKQTYTRIAFSWHLFIFFLCQLRIILHFIYIFLFRFFSVSWYSIPFRFMKIRMIFAPFYSLVLIFEIHELLCWHQIKFILQIAQS